ncbi:hypothetical protein ACFOGJ_04840 [Marinibaculum pumilum]|uniref:HPt domain-containing protein n=1 Tax=Marinibaculum pumilum TaxID=1766165 RepID=A0ABV7KWL6_9PROT
MSLTQVEARSRDAARLEELTFEIFDAIRSHDPHRFNAASESLEGFSTDITIATALRDEAHRVRSHAALDLQDQALTDFRQLADRIAGTGAALAIAAKAAETGKEALFLPTLGAHAQRGLAVLKELKATAEAIDAKLANVDLTELRSTIDVAQAAFEDMKSAAKAIRGL